MNGNAGACPTCERTMEWDYEDHYYWCRNCDDAYEVDGDGSMIFIGTEWSMRYWPKDVPPTPF